METIEYKPTNYRSHLSDRQWEQIAECFPQRPNSEHKRSLINAVLYLTNNGCKWRALPQDFPPYSTVHTFCRRARVRGLWEKVLQAIVEKTRLKAGRDTFPSYGMIDSKSVRTVYASDERGIDDGKNEGTKKVHRSGYDWEFTAVVVHAANIHDIKSGTNPARQARESPHTLEKFCAERRVSRYFCT